MSNVAQEFGLTLHKGFLLGCEFELEYINDVSFSTAEIAALFANITEDNSLRNYGREFVTRPLTVEKAIKAHDALFNSGSVYYNNVEESCSDRCSTHIHVNFTDVSIDKVIQFIRLYALVEPLFFKAVNETRQNNIYCVPICSTHLLKTILNSSIGHLVEKWHKYAAFNIKRLSDLGTIEFRHFEATQDTAKFVEWIRMIKALYDFNMSRDIEILINDVVLYQLVAAVAGRTYTRDEIYKICEDTLVNDMLLTVNPTKALLNQRLQASKETV